MILEQWTTEDEIEFLKQLPLKFRRWQVELIRGGMRYYDPPASLNEILKFVNGGRIIL